MSTATQPARVEDLTQKEAVLWHLRNFAEIDRTVADEEYDIGRLAARIRDLKDDGYVFDTWKEDGIAHYSLVDEPMQKGRQNGRQSRELPHESAEDLWRALPKNSLARRYVAYLARCAKGKEVVGMLEEATRPEGVSDWEAAACMDGEDLRVGRITRCREELCREGPLIVSNGHRRGQETYRLHPNLI